VTLGLIRHAARRALCLSDPLRKHLDGCPTFDPRRGGVRGPPSSGRLTNPRARVLGVRPTLRR
jgi:hypothetical protein